MVFVTKFIPKELSLVIIVFVILVMISLEEILVPFAEPLLGQHLRLDKNMLNPNIG